MEEDNESPFTLVPSNKKSYRQLQKKVNNLSEMATTTTEWVNTITKKVESIVQQTKNFMTTQHSNPDDALAKLTVQVSQLEVQLSIISESERNHCLIVANEICKKFDTAIRFYVMHGWLRPDQTQRLNSDEYKKILDELPKHLTDLKIRCNETPDHAIQKRWKEICGLLGWKPDFVGGRDQNFARDNAVLIHVSTNRNDIAHPAIKPSEVNVEELESHKDLKGIGNILTGIKELKEKKQICVE